MCGPITAPPPPPIPPPARCCRRPAPPHPSPHSLQKDTAPRLHSFATFLVVEFWLSAGVAGWYVGEHVWKWWKVRHDAKVAKRKEAEALAASELPPGSPGSGDDAEDAAVEAELAGEGEEEGAEVRRRSGRSKRVSAGDVDADDDGASADGPGGSSKRR